MKYGLSRTSIAVENQPVTIPGYPLALTSRDGDVYWRQCPRESEERSPLSLASCAVWDGWWAPQGLEGGLCAWR